MTTRTQHRILITSDGSPSARSAIKTAISFPWGASSLARAVVARYPWPGAASEAAQAILHRSAEIAADEARRDLAWRWREAEVVFVHEPPAEAIVRKAQRFGATIIVLGWRGHGTFRRLLMGSVSRSVAESAACSVLVVREAPQAVRRFVVAYDASPNAKCAIDLLAGPDPAPETHAVVTYVVEPLSVPASVNRLHDAGWAASGDMRIGAPVASLLDAVDEHRADVLVAGACATSGLERPLLGSVAHALLNRSPVPVLLAR